MSKPNKTSTHGASKNDTFAKRTRAAGARLRVRCALTAGSWTSWIADAATSAGNSQGSTSTGGGKELSDAPLHDLPWGLN